MPDINYKKLIRNLLICAVLLLAVSGYLEYTRVYLTPERRFWMAMENNLSVPSVVRTVQTGGTGNLSVEKTRLTFGAQAVQDKVSSVSLKNATADSNVTTETITTPTNQYVRYKTIRSNEKKEDGSSYDFSSVLNVWASQGLATDEASADDQRLTFEQPLITLAMFGNLKPEARKQVIQELKTSGAYEVDTKTPTYSVIDGQKYIQYSVRVKTKKYVEVLQHHFTKMGYGTFPPLDSNNYTENARVNSFFAVNMRNNTLARIEFNGQAENYSDYGVTMPVVIPKDPITVDELQTKLQNAQ